MILGWFLDAWNHVFYCKYNSFGLLCLLLWRLKNLWILHPFWHRLDTFWCEFYLNFSFRFRDGFLDVFFGIKVALRPASGLHGPRNGAKTESAWVKKREGKSCIATPPSRTPYFSWFFLDFDNILAISVKLWRPICDFWHQFRHPNLCICALTFRSNVA